MSAAGLLAPLLAAGVFFDDFSYADGEALARGGWSVRTAPGHPGIPGAAWARDGVQLVDDDTRRGNRLLQLEAHTDGTPAGSAQAQLCHARKYLRGTYAARVRFSDAPVQGSDGDPVVQTFYAVSPLRHDFDPTFSEIDWEYLPNGGWGDERTRLYGIAWQTAQLDPWQAHNQAQQVFGSHAGWHQLVVQVADDHTRWFLDGRPVARHGGRNQPVVEMSIRFNLWFSPGALLPPSAQPRRYRQQVDWVYHAQQRLLSPAQVAADVQRLRSAGRAQVDSVPARPDLSGGCDF
jgi:hypothetical protein